MYIARPCIITSQCFIIIYNNYDKCIGPGNNRPSLQWLHRTWEYWLLPVHLSWSSSVQVQQASVGKSPACNIITWLYRILTHCNWWHVKISLWLLYTIITIIIVSCTMQFRSLWPESFSAIYHYNYIIYFYIISLYKLWLLW